MYSSAEVVIFNTVAEPQNSGTRIIKQSDSVVDINELHRALLDSSKFVVVSNDVSKWSEATERQNFIITDKLVTEEGYVDTFVMSHFGKSLSATTNRRIVLSFSEFSDEPTIKATYGT